MKPGNKCGQGHSLTRIQSPADGCCDVCEAPVLTSEWIWYCEPCDWGYCQTCADKAATKKTEAEDAPLAAAQEELQPAECGSDTDFKFCPDCAVSPPGCEPYSSMKEQFLGGGFDCEACISKIHEEFVRKGVCPICVETGWDCCAACRITPSWQKADRGYSDREARYAKAEGLDFAVQYPGDAKRTNRPIEGVPDRMLTMEQYEVRKSNGAVLGMGSIGWRTGSGKDGGWKSPLEHEASTIFSTIDVDKSGLITPMEFETRLGDFGMDTSSTEQLFIKMDANADGFISQAEFIDAYPDWALECGYETRADKGVGWTDEEKLICLDVHNRLRKLHAAKPLKWSDKLAKKAQKAANICETENRLYHPVAGANNASENSTFEEAICMWWEEVYHYDWDKPSVGLQEDGYLIGHFCQVVWGSATEVGMARSTVGNGSVVFAFYDAGPGAGIDTRSKQLKATWGGNVKINKAGRNIIRANMERMGMDVHYTQDGFIKPKAG